MKRTTPLKRKQSLQSKSSLSATSTITRKTALKTKTGLQTKKPLKAKTGLKTKTDLKRAGKLEAKTTLRASTTLQRKQIGEGRGGGLRRGSRLKANPETLAASKRWSEAVFAMFGPFCFFHRLRDPDSNVRAVHAAHIIKRSKMGAAIAYGPKDGPPQPKLGRPLCRDCHERQETNLEPAYRFSLALRVEAIEIHNSYAEKKLKVPEK